MTSTTVESMNYQQHPSNTSVPVTSPAVSSATSKRVHREVRFGAYILGSTLGEGEFGKVKLGWRKDGKHPSQVAIKLIKRDTIVKDSESEIKIHREINSLRLLNHPNIVNLVEVLKSGKYIGIVLEYASGGELFDYILQHKYLKENVAKKLFAQLVSGVDYMHSKGLIHRDLKLENLLLDKHRNIIISDFGFVNSYNKDKNDLMKTSCGSPCYAAPELVLTQSPYSGRKVDIWSLGVILYAMLAGYLPFDDDSENEDGADIVKLYHYICNTPLTFPEYVSPLARDLLRKIIVSNPEKRIGVDEIRNHPWLAPHANLLSIRQPEWDKVHTEDREKWSVAQSMNKGNKYKRFSMFNETTNSSALMMGSNKNTNGRSYTSNSNIIYSNPTTSSSLANVVALTNSSDTNLAASASSIMGNSTSTVSSNVSKTSTESGSPVKSSQLGYARGHSKSASMSGTYPTASIALKAMVSEHERKAQNSVENESTHDTPPSFSPSQIPRSTTYTGTISTIVESPTPPDSKGVQINPAVVRSKFNEPPKDTAKLPQSHKKPRPTSYHPGSMTSLMSLGNGSSSNFFDYVKIGSPINFSVPQFISGSPTKSDDIISSMYERAVHGSPGSQTTVTTKSRNANRRDSVVTPINVNGVLTSDLSLHENKRNSVLSYLEDKIDALELTESHSPIRQYAEDNVSKPQRIPKLDTNLQPPQTTPQIDQSPTFASPIESPKEKMVVKVSEKVDKDSNESEHKIFDGSEMRDHRRKTQEVVSRGETNKENRESKDSKDHKDQKEQKRRNRFSILSFYGGSSNNSSSDVASAPSRKVLEPSNDINVGTPVNNKEQKRVESSSSHKSSQSRKSGSSGNGVYANGKEASAARKVMNFFKRRSVRIG
ncbi:Protein kinase domain family protein [Clavispora lusitaniae]|uniref:non-specific serine/threonine protein kinase n=1 Tax=Clavispora lusitaniae (strain ATCC 42720) TaxID=306902 RepID=C4Y8V7_CLAL4|nr:uncharacterized protein CLUG_04635 [Clavispora lusitaniae ATCC 42720]EEQ40507.1 hypothetical protein CLUG_04635 [Clavispora lusitaniae ATCC 42720]KAF5209551.1 hypothetical protein E0198_003853 [Clavispora lusitaniae]KAF7581572.1 Protein kinase domain family protein [Clavispora lusitaniae]